jgi:DNA transposition AAA+ family ATPase
MQPTILPSTSRHAAATSADPERRADWRATDPALRGELAAWIERQGYSREAAGHALGFPDGTPVSKYLGDKFDRDPGPFEKRVREALAAERRARHYGGKVISTNVVQKLAVFIDRIRQTSTCGVFSGEAGIGKTVAIGAYLADNPTALSITVNSIQSDARGVKQLLWAAAEGPAGYNRPHYDWLAGKLRSGSRPILVDQAQHLGGGGRAFLFGLHDLTGSPIIFVGNPDILAQIARSDQEHSRTPKHCPAELKDPKRVASAMIAQHLDDPGVILDLALAVVAKPLGGHLRALSHLLADMRVLMEHPSNAGDPRGCFKKALAASIDHASLALSD